MLEVSELNKLHAGKRWRLFFSYKDDKMMMTIIKMTMIMMIIKLTMIMMIIKITILIMIIKKMAMIIMIIMKIARKSHLFDQLTIKAGRTNTEWNTYQSKYKSIADHIDQS